MRLLTDENFNNHINRALLLQRPGVDLIRAQDAGLSGKNDDAVLEWALMNNRILLTHDAKTIPLEAFSRIHAGREIPGIFIVPWQSAIGQVVADILLILDCSEQEEWMGKIHYLPL